MPSDLNRRTKDYYDGLVSDLGAEYLKFRWGNHPLQRSHYRQTRRSIERFFRETATHRGRLLEFGCGPGTWTGICLDHADEVTLLDISVEMLRAARHRFGDDPRIRYLCADLLEASVVEDGVFDTVFSARAFEYIEDKPAAIRKVRRALRPGGVLGMITKNPGWRDKRRDDTRGHVDAAGIQVDWIGWKTLASMLGEAGFEAIQVRPVALGSYHRPYNNRLGFAIAEALQWLSHRSSMRDVWDPLTESYLVTARAA